jgi:hypothetical protein
MLAYRARMQSALDGLDQTPMPPEWRDNERTILRNNLAFMDDCLAKGDVSFAALQAFTKKQAPLPEARHRVGRADAGRPLDESTRGLEEDAWR